MLLLSLNEQGSVPLYYNTVHVLLHMRVLASCHGNPLT